MSAVVLSDRERTALMALQKLAYTEPEKANNLNEIVWRGYLRRGRGWGQTFASLERKGLTGSLVEVTYQDTDIPARKRWWITAEGQAALKS